MCLFICSSLGDVPKAVGVALCVSKNLSDIVCKLSCILLNLSLNSHTWRSANPFAAGCARAVRAWKYIYIYLVYVCNRLFHLTLVEQGRETKTLERLRGRLNSLLKVVTLTPWRLTVYKVIRSYNVRVCDALYLHLFSCRNLQGNKIEELPLGIFSNHFSLKKL